MSGILHQVDVPSAYRLLRGDIALKNSAGSAGPLSWKERDRVRCTTSPEVNHTSPQPSLSRRGSSGADRPSVETRRGSRSARYSP
jgi:hypothetical protein